MDFKRFFLDVDVVLHWLQSDYGWSNELDTITKLRPVFGWRIIPQLSIYAGPTFDFLASNVRDKLGIAAGLFKKTRSNGIGEPPTTFQLGLSFVAGISYEPRVGKLNSF